MVADITFRGVRIVVVEDGAVVRQVKLRASADAEEPNDTGPTGIVGCSLGANPRKALIDVQSVRAQIFELHRSGPLLGDNPAGSIDVAGQGDAGAGSGRDVQIFIQDNGRGDRMG